MIFLNFNRGNRTLSLNKALFELVVENDFDHMNVEVTDTQIRFSLLFEQVGDLCLLKRYAAGTVCFFRNDYFRQSIPLTDAVMDKLKDIEPGRLYVRYDEKTKTLICERVKEQFKEEFNEVSKEVGDKLVGRYGNRGVVSNINPMHMDADSLYPSFENNEVDLILSPMQIASCIEEKGMTKFVQDRLGIIVDESTDLPEKIQASSEYGQRGSFVGTIGGTGGSFIGTAMAMGLGLTDKAKEHMGSFDVFDGDILDSGAQMEEAATTKQKLYMNRKRRRKLEKKQKKNETKMRLAITEAVNRRDNKKKKKKGK